MAPTAERAGVHPYRMDHQYDVIRLVEELTDVPVPKVRWIDAEGSVLGSPVLPDGSRPRASCPRRDALHLRRQLVRRRRTEQQRNCRTHGGGAGASCTRSPDADNHVRLPHRRRPPGGDTHAAPPAQLAQDWYEFAVPGIGRSRRWWSGRSWLENFPADVAAGEPVLAWVTRGSATCSTTTSGPVAVLDWEMADAFGPRELDVAWIIFAHMVFQELAGLAGCLGCRRSCARRTSAPPTGKLTGVELGDLRWFTSTPGVIWCVVYAHRCAAVHFGEIEQPGRRSLFTTPGPAAPPDRGRPMLGPMDEYPSPGAPADRVAGPRTATSTTGPTTTPTTAPATSSSSPDRLLPEPGVKDAFFLVRRGDVQTAVHPSGRHRPGPAEPSTSTATASRSSSRCRSGSCWTNRGHRSRSHVGGCSGGAEQPHVMRQGTR